MDYFTLLNITPAFEIDLAKLEQAYFSAQRQYHPDRFASKPDTQRHAAMQRSVDCNQAYDTLKNPLKRAQYILKLQGVLVGGDKDTVKPPHALLIDVMEWREESAENPQKWYGQLVQLQEESISRIRQHYEKQDWQAMAHETLRLGYIVKTLEEMKIKDIAL